MQSTIRWPKFQGVKIYGIQSTCKLNYFMERQPECKQSERCRHAALFSTRFLKAKWSIVASLFCDLQATTFAYYQVLTFAYICASDDESWWRLHMYLQVARFTCTVHRGLRIVLYELATCKVRRLRTCKCKWRHLRTCKWRRLHTLKWQQSDANMIPHKL